MALDLEFAVGDVGEQGGDLADGALAVAREVGRTRGEEHVRGQDDDHAPVDDFDFELAGVDQRLEAGDESLELGDAGVGLGLALGELDQGELHLVDRGLELLRVADHRGLVALQGGLVAFEGGHGLVGSCQLGLEARDLGVELFGLGDLGVEAGLQVAALGLAFGEFGAGVGEFLLHRFVGAAHDAGVGQRQGEKREKKGEGLGHLHRCGSLLRSEVERGKRPRPLAKTAAAPSMRAPPVSSRPSGVTRRPFARTGDERP